MTKPGADQRLKKPHDLAEESEVSIERLSRRTRAAAKSQRNAVKSQQITAKSGVGASRSILACRRPPVWACRDPLP